MTVFGIFGDDVTFDVGVINDAFVEPILTLQTAIIIKIQQQQKSEKQTLKIIQFQFHTKISFKNF